MIYLDHNATTPLDARVRTAMVETLSNPALDGNPSSVHRFGQHARALVEEARYAVAASVGAEPLEVTFTSGGTEADNLAVVGTLRALKTAGRPAGLLTSPIEHPAVLDAGLRLERQGHERVLVEPDPQGRICPQAVVDALRRHPGIGLVSLAAGNHELGNAYDIPHIVEAIRRVVPGVLVHCDAVQAYGKVRVDFVEWDVDLLSVSAHKVYGPKGVGALVHRRRIRIDPIVYGGHQERGRRPGTEPVVLVHGFGVAANLVSEEREQRFEHTSALRAELLDGLVELTGWHVHGDPVHHTGNTVNVGFDGCEGELLLINLDLAGIAVSTGSACTAGSLEPSHVLLAIGCTPVEGRSALRISFGKDNARGDVATLLEQLPGAIARVRALEAPHVDDRWAG